MSRPYCVEYWWVWLAVALNVAIVVAVAANHFFG